MPRHTVINLSAKATCKMFFVLGKDNIGFFLVTGCGSAEHSGHIKIDPEQKASPTRLLKEEDVQLLKSVGKANALNTTGWHILYANTGQYLSSAQVRYRAQMGKVLSLVPQNDLPDDVIQKSTEGGPDRLFAYFELEKISYSCLYYTVSHTRTATSTNKSASSHIHEAVAGENGQDSALVANELPHSARVELSSDAHDDLKKFAEEYRQDLGVNDVQKLLIGFGWVLPEELRKF
jgi:hypothetical protein